MVDVGVMVDELLTKDTIFSSLQDSKRQLLSFGIRTIGLFGSFVRAEAKPESDIDILVDFEAEKKNYDNFIEACFFLEDLFHRKVELVTTESLSPYMKQHILKEVEYVPLTH
jgi:hypothetical protein